MQLIASAKQSVHEWRMRTIRTDASVSWFDVSWLLEWYAQSLGTHCWGTLLTNRISASATQ